MQSAGVPTSLEPNCSKVAGANPVTTAGARTHILTVLQDGLLLSDASVTHCCADTYVERAAATARAAAEVRAQRKVRKYALHGPAGYDFTPLVVEFYGRQCMATHALLNKLGHLAADSGRVTKGAWIEGALLVSQSASPPLQCSLAPPCPLSLSGPPLATVVPAGSLFDVVFAGCAAHTLFFRCHRSIFDDLFAFWIAK